MKRTVIALSIAGTVGLGAGFVAYQGRMFTNGGPLEAAFRNAWRDDFGTDVTDDIASVLSADRAPRDMVDLARADGFSCAASKLTTDRRIWVCMRRAWSLNLIVPKLERWILEFECNPTRSQCSAIRHAAAISFIP